MPCNGYFFARAALRTAASLTVRNRMKFVEPDDICVPATTPNTSPALSFYCRTSSYSAARTISSAVRAAEYELVRQEKLKAGDVLGVVAGTQMSSGSTNFMRLRTVREAAVRRAARAKK